MAADDLKQKLFEAVTADSTGDGGLPRRARAAEPGNFLRHAVALALTKLADGLLDPKLVLSWLLAQLGASSLWVGLLVPIREAGALLPQLFAAPRVHAMARRKWAWSVGSAVQGLAVAGILGAALVLTGGMAGAVICLLLAVLAVARSICSVSYKDILGKTVGKSRRGTVTGLASSTASVGVIAFALVLMWEPAGRMALVLGALALAAIFWLAAALVLAALDEMPTPRAPSRTPWGQLALLRDDPQLARFIVVRGLLTATALAPPYLILLGGEGQDWAAGLGALVLASAAASLVSSYFWGRLADRSSKSVLRLCGVTGAVALGAALGLDGAGLTGAPLVLPGVMFVLMVAYRGVREGRSTYLVDMAPEDQRPAYTAVANTVIGLVLLASGVFGALTSLAGPAATLGLFAAMSLAAAIVGAGLDEVEQG